MERVLVIGRIAKAGIEACNPPEAAQIDIYKNFPGVLQ